MTTYTVAVRALCEFAAKHGDLDLRFTPSPSARQGMAGHRNVAQRRASSHRTEVTVSAPFEQLVVRGRADGYDPKRLWLEEVKTYRGDLGRMPDNQRALHWAQARTYAWLLCRQFDLAGLNVALVYYDVDLQQEAAPIVQYCAAAELQRSFEALCRRFLGWAQLEMAHRARRDRDLGALRFPHETFRAGQRALAEAVYRGARDGHCLLAQAPTGIGKTIGTLFPLLKACPIRGLDKVLFLTAKGSGRTLAWQAVDRIRFSQPALSLRVIELVSREQACEHPDKVCHGESCALARGFYDRLPAARDAAVGLAMLDRQALRRVALEHGVCPYYLAQDVVRWCDVVIGDYNHYFDSSALLHALAVVHDWRLVALVDEAHNLVERARSMYTATLDPVLWRQMRRTAPLTLRRPLQRLHRAWGALEAEQPAAYVVRPQPPRRFVAALQAVASALSEALAQTAGALDACALRFYFDVLAFLRLLETFDDHSLFDVSRPQLAHGATAALPVPCVRNVLPAPFLGPRWARAHASVLFSATLTPQRYYADTLGLPQDTQWLEVEAPFAPEQLTVRVVPDVSTRWRDRAASLAPIAELIACEYRARPGNYLAFFSSFDYLQRAAAEFGARHPDIVQWSQSRGMADAERTAFLERFVDGGQGIGFAVLGGSFGEGVDLPGTRLIGAFIATLGLPQVNPVNEALRMRMDARFGSGYEYTYLFPGLRKVVQAAGRVIRTLSDRGSVHLIDDRYASAQVLALLPRWWVVEHDRVRPAAATRARARAA